MVAATCGFLGSLRSTTVTDEVGHGPDPAVPSVDTTAVRLRYTRPSDDSTRVLVELWGRCARQRACASGAIASLVEGMSTADAPPP